MRQILMTSNQCHKGGLVVDKSSEEKLEDISQKVEAMAVGYLSDINQRVHSIERWQVKVDAFMERGEIHAKKIESQLQALSKAVWFCTGAVGLAGSVIAVILTM